MRHLLVAALLTAGLSAQDKPSTYHEVLGKDGVEAVMKAVIAETALRLSSTYVVTDETVERLKNSGVSPGLLGLLGNLKGKEFQSREEFLGVLRTRLGRVQAERLKTAILVNTQGYLVVSEEFFNPVEAMILATEVTERGSASSSLEMGFRMFLNAYIEHLRAESGNTNRIALRDKNLLAFIDSLRGKCNERPCYKPPCCDKCKSCKSN